MACSVSRGALCVIAILFCSMVLPSVEGLAQLVLRRFSENEIEKSGARCLDGTGFGYYFAAARGHKNATKWVILMESGGYCFGETSCKLRSKIEQGTSQMWPMTIPASFGLITDNEFANPHFHDWNFVKIPYCSGDWHTGQRKEATDETFGLYFAGHLNVKEVVNDIIKQYRFREATDVVVTGTSAGGYGVFMNADFFKEVLPQAKVVAVPQAGLFYWPLTYPHWNQTLEKMQARGLQAEDLPCEGDIIAASYDVPLQDLYNLFQSYAPASCLKATPVPDRYKCLNPGHAIPHMQTPLFVSNHIYDADQIFKDLQAPKYSNPMHPQLSSYVDYFGHCMLRLKDHVLAKPENGVFMPSCLAHLLNVLGPVAPRIHGQTMLDTLGNWYAGKSGGSLVDPCTDVMCNPTCLPPDHITQNHHGVHNEHDDSDLYAAPVPLHDGKSETAHPMLGRVRGKKSHHKKKHHKAEKHHHRG